MLDTVRPWDTLNDDEKRLFTRMAEVFAGYISYYDDRLGRVLDYLEESGQLDNTLVIVVSDNGASGEGGPNGSFNEWRFFNGVPDTTETTLPHIDELGTPASNNHYNTGWAWALDTPFPYWKRWAGEEGGTADMLLVSWPAQIAASDEVRHQYVHAVDIVPTVYDLLGIEPPEVINGYPQIPIEGESFASALRDPSVPGKRTQFYTMLGQRALYHDGWLLTTVHPPLSSWGNFEKDEWELFHLETDRSQSNNVAADHPDLVEELKGLWFYYAGRYNGLPLDDRSALEQVLSERPHGRSRPRPVRLLPGLRRRAGVGRAADPRPLVHDRRRRRPSTPPRSRVSSGPPAGCPVGTPSTSRTACCATRSTGWAPTSRTSSPPTPLTPGAHVCVAEFVAERARARTRPCPARPARSPSTSTTRRSGSAPIITQPGYFCLTGDGICVGRDSASAVTPEYQAPFPFTGGTIDKVVVDVCGDRYVDHEAIQALGAERRDAAREHRAVGGDIHHRPGAHAARPGPCVHRLLHALGWGGGAGGFEVKAQLFGQRLARPDERLLFGPQVLEQRLVAGGELVVMVIVPVDQALQVHFTDAESVGDAQKVG